MKSLVQSIWIAIPRSAVANNKDHIYIILSGENLSCLITWTIYMKYWIKIVCNSRVKLQKMQKKLEKALNLHLRPKETFQLFSDAWANNENNNISTIYITNEPFAWSYRTWNTVISVRTQVSMLGDKNNVSFHLIVLKIIGLFLFLYISIFIFDQMQQKCSTFLINQEKSTSVH